MFTAFGVAGVTGPYIAGRIRDHFGSYHNAFTISAVMLLLGALLAFLLKAPEPEAAKLAAGPAGKARASRNARQSRCRTRAGHVEHGQAALD